MTTITPTRRSDLNPHLTENERMLLSTAEFLWAVLANVSGGDWLKQPLEWQEAAAKARDDFHAAAAKLKAHVA